MFSATARTLQQELLSPDVSAATLELNKLIDDFLPETGATYPRPSPACKPAADANETAAAELDAWKQRGCTATIADGVLTMKGTGVAGTAFLGYAAGSLTAPATVTLCVPSETGGAVRIDCQALPSLLKDQHSLQYRQGSMAKPSRSNWTMAASAC